VIANIFGKHNKNGNILLHCKSSFGRTGFIIFSYIWYRKCVEDETFRKNRILFLYDYKNKIRNENDIDNNVTLQYLFKEIKKYHIRSYVELRNDR